MKLFTDLKLNFCIPTASLLLLASFGAWAQAQPPCSVLDFFCLEKERQRLYMEQMNKKMQQQPPSQQNPEQRIHLQPIQQQMIQQQPIQQQPIQQQPITQPNQQQTTEQIASLKADLKLLTEKNQRMIESAMRYGACLTAAQGEALNLTIHVQRNTQLFNIHFPKEHINMLSKSNICHRQFTDSFK